MFRAPIRIALGAVIVTAAIVFAAPATLLDSTLTAQTHGAWQLTAARGLWWRGDGVLASADGRSAMPVAWRVRLVALLRGSLTVDLAGDDGKPLGAVLGLARGFSLRDLHLRVPAGLAAALLPPSGVSAYGGLVALSAREFTWDGSRADGAIDADWTRARMAIAGSAIDLGRVFMALAARQGDITGTLHNTGGELAIDGTISGQGSSVSAALTLRPGTATPAALRRLLPLLGAPDASGAVRLAWHGR